MALSTPAASSSLLGGVGGQLPSVTFICPKAGGRQLSPGGWRTP